jgi:mRNA-degrading endonuclease RelE of RelBE toxin-antitoxin system
MKYELRFTDDGQKALNSLEREEQQRIARKLNRIATCPYRDPTDWDFVRMGGRAEGRLCITDGIRVFADIDEECGVIRIHKVGRRENLYT